MSVCNVYGLGFSLRFDERVFLESFWLRLYVIFGVCVQVVKKSATNLKFLSDVGKHWVSLSSTFTHHTLIHTHSESHTQTFLFLHFLCRVTQWLVLHLSTRPISKSLCSESPSTSRSAKYTVHVQYVCALLYMCVIYVVCCVSHRILRCLEI